MKSSDRAARLSIARPPPQVVDAARHLDEAVTAHLSGETERAAELIRAADFATLYVDWLKPIMASSERHLIVPLTQLIPRRPKAERDPVRMPSKDIRTKIHQRDGYNCRFCGIPVIRPEIRRALRAKYPEALRWGRRDTERHAGFLVMWAQYDHVLPHALGGTNDFENLVLACAACNFGRAGYSLEEVGVEDPRARPVVVRNWDGLERFR